MNPATMHIINNTFPTRRVAPPTGWRTTALIMVLLWLAQMAWIFG